jgi:hypothetical protein
MTNEYPSNGKPDWSEQAQGLAHDVDNWFITQDGNLWRVPVSINLNHVTVSTPHVKLQPWGSVLELSTNHFCHWGDPDYHDGYVFVPIEHSGFWGNCEYSWPLPGVAVFKADTLDFVAWQSWPDGFGSASWCAIDNGHRLYTSAGKPTSELHCYVFDWESLVTNKTLVWSALWTNVLYDETGSNPADLRGSQGGEFSETKQLLYIVTDERIEVFDTTTWRRLKRSFNPSIDACGSAAFVYRCGGDLEAEGVTIWDLDADTRAPGIRGQLHVLLLNNIFADRDGVDIKHYDARIYVDKNSGQPECPPLPWPCNALPVCDCAWPCGCGSVGYPFHTLAPALAAGGAGSKIVIRGGTYPENITLATKMQLQSWDGNTVTIGQ